MIPRARRATSSMRALSPPSLGYRPPNRLPTLLFLLPRFASSGWKQGKTVKDDSIPFDYAHVINPITKGLDPQTSVAGLLRSIDRKTQFLQLMSREPPIVKIVDREEARIAAQAFKEKQKLVKKRAPDDKEVQMTWTVEQGDLTHKMNKVKDELGKGNRVAVTLSTKTPRAPPDAARKVLEDKVKDELKGLGTEWKEPERSKRTTILFFKPPTGPRPSPPHIREES